MAAIYGFDPPDYGLVESDPLLFRQQFQAFVDALADHQNRAGDVQRVNAELSRALDEAQSARAELESRHAAERQRYQQLAEAHEALRTQHAVALAAYRQAMLDGDPSIPPELVEGETLDALNASLAKARGVVQYIKEKLAQPGGAGVPGQTATAPTPSPRVPAGAPGRTLPDLSAMSPRDKLVWGTSRLAG